MDYATLVGPDAIERTVKGLAARNVEATVVEDGAAALETIKGLIPAGASGMNGSSRTLEEIGFIECIGNSNAILPMTTVAGVPPFHFGGTHA